jgi:hypothetical protein
VELIRKRANIAAGDRITLVPYPGKRSLLDRFLRGPDENAGLETKVGLALGKLPVRALSKGGYLKLMPYTIRVR